MDEYDEVKDKLLDELRDSRELLLAYTRQLLAQAEEGAGSKRFKVMLQKYVEKLKH